MELQPPGCGSRRCSLTSAWITYEWYPLGNSSTKLGSIWRILGKSTISSSSSFSSFSWLHQPNRYSPFCSCNLACSYRTGSLLLPPWLIMKAGRNQCDTAIIIVISSEKKLALLCGGCSSFKAYNGLNLREHNILKPAVQQPMAHRRIPCCHSLALPSSFYPLYLSYIFLFQGELQMLKFHFSSLLRTICSLWKATPRTTTNITKYIIKFNKSLQLSLPHISLIIFFGLKFVILHKTIFILSYN